MAYMITHFWPGATEDQYKATVAVVHPPRGLPEGQSYHVAGMTDGGVLITAVWDSKEQNDRFLHDVLMASMPVLWRFASPHRRIVTRSKQTPS